MLRILIAEDNPVTQRLLCNYLAKWNYEATCVSDGEEALEVLQKDDTLKLVILDWMMPKMDGLEVCREIRQLDRNSYVYIILFTAKDGDESLVEAMNAGADDYIVKSPSRHELRARLRAGERILALEEKLLSVQEQLRAEAMHDHLTGLLNHSAILDLLDREVNRARRTGSRLSVAMADLDYFKRVNDTHGHLSGDIVLSEAAIKISQSLRRYDVVGRYGGEEFLVVIPGCTQKAARLVCDRILQAVRAKPFALAQAIVPLTVSIGVATLDFKDSEVESESLLLAADLALYKAKCKGRNCVVVATSLQEPHDAVVEKRSFCGLTSPGNIA